MKKIRVVFTYYPLYVRYNYGVALLVELCRRAGIQAYVVPMDLEAAFLEKVSSIAPDYVCVSYVCEKDYHAAMPFVESVKRTGVPMLAGGVYARKGAYIKPGLFDHVCRGDGEALPDFFLHGDTRLFDEACVCEDIASLPLPDYASVSGFEFERGFDFLRALKILPYSSSRGCPFSCSFCEVQYQPKGTRIRNTIRQDLDILYEGYLPDLFYFLDELVPYYDPAWVKQMDGNQYPFMCYIRADIDEASLLRLCDNGMQVCAFGVESGDEEHRNKVLGKGITNDQIFATVAALQDRRVTYIPFYMLNTPFETAEIRARTFAMSRELGGHPAIWEYEDVGKKVFSIPDGNMNAYCRKLDVPKELLRGVLDDPSFHVVSNNGSFLVYRLGDDCVLINDVFGDGRWAMEEATRLCQRHGKPNIRGIAKKRSEAFERKYGFKVIGYVINKGVQ